MHVLYLIDSLTPGGAERSLVALAPCYASRGIDLEVGYLIERPGVHDELLDAGVRLFPLDGSGGRVARIRRARELALERRPDLIHTTLFEADLAGRVAARLTGIPVVSSLVNVAYWRGQRTNTAIPAWRLQAARLVDLVTARFVTRFHAISRHVAEVMSRRLRISPTRIDVVPRGRDPETLGLRTPERAAGARGRIGVPAGAPLILAAGRNERQKGLDVLIRAFPNIQRDSPSARLIIAGREGNETKKLRALVEALGLRDDVMFLGPRDDLPDLLCCADVFVFPSRWEGAGGAVLEAMALETPIVASDIPPLREVLGEDLATLVPPERIEALADAVIATLENIGPARRRSALARARFLDRFTVDRVADDMVAFYERALPTLKR